MNTHYTPKSKYYSKELNFREKYPDANVCIETHWYKWQGKRETNVIDAELLGFPSGIARRTSMYWIVARTALQPTK